LWSIWIARNQCVFNQVRWRSELVYSMLRSGLIEYAKAAWSRTCTRTTKDPAATAKALNP
jgi:hypothetical protein